MKILCRLGRHKRYPLDGPGILNVDACARCGVVLRADPDQPMVYDVQVIDGAPLVDDAGHYLAFHNWLSPAEAERKYGRPTKP